MRARECGVECNDGQECASCFFFFQAEDGIRDYKVTGVQTCALLLAQRVCNSKIFKPKSKHCDVA